MFTDFRNFVNKYRIGKATQAADILNRQSNNIPKNNAIVVCNQKGGCAKTTTAVNLSSCLADKGYSVLLIDLDPQAHASLGLGVDVTSLDKTVYDVLIKNADLESVIRETQVSNLNIAAASSILSGAQLDLADMLGRETILKTAIRKLRLIRDYDFIFMDCSPSLNLITINAMVACDFVLIPIQTHYYSLEGMKELFYTIEVVKERLNSELGVLGILATLFDTRTKISHQVLGQIRDLFKEMVLKSVIHNNVKLCEAPMFKQPIHLYAPASQGARDYWELTEEIIALIYPDKKVNEEAQKEPEICPRTENSPV